MGLDLKHGFSKKRIAGVMTDKTSAHLKHSKLTVFASFSDIFSEDRHKTCLAGTTGIPPICGVCREDSCVRNAFYSLFCAR